MEKSFVHKIHIETLELYYTTDQRNMTDTYRNSQPTAPKFTLLFVEYRNTFQEKVC
jgi:hypothetical protein